MNSSPTSQFGLLLSLVACGIYAYSSYFMNFNPNLKQMSKLQPESLRQFGQYKFLTYQCLHIQLLSSILHILAHFVKALRPLRDLVFNCLAYPVGSVVVYTFWAVWHSVGRENIFPVEVSQFYPDWLNHATHTIIAPINLLLVISIHHLYKPFACLFTLLYFACYVGLLLHIKSQSGWFVYKYLELMDHTELAVYFSGTALLAYLMYKTGQFLTSLVHGSSVSYQQQQQQLRPVPRKPKQK